MPNMLRNYFLFDDTEAGSLTHADGKHRLVLSLLVLFYLSFFLVIEDWSSKAWIPLFLYSLFSYLKSYKPVSLHGYEKIIIFCLLMFFVARLFMISIDGDFRAKHLDNHIRFVLAIVIYLAVRRYGIYQNIFIFTLFISSLCAAAVSIYQIVFLDYTYATGALHKIKFGGLSLLIAAFSCLILFFKKKMNKLDYWFLVGSIALSLIASGLAMSRGAWLSIPVFLIFLFILIYRLGGNFPLKTFFIYLLGFALLITAVFISSEKYMTRLTVVAKNMEKYYSQDKKKVKGSAGTRLEMWKASILMYKESPWLGVGVGNYNKNKEILISEKKVSKKLRKYAHPHSDYFLVLSEQGLIGLIIYLGLMFGLVTVLFRSVTLLDQWPLICALWLVVAYLLYGLTEPYFRFQNTVVFFAVMISVLAGLGFHLGRDTKPEAREVLSKT